MSNIKFNEEADSIYDVDFFKWLRENNKLDLYEAMLDTIEDFRDMKLNLKAQKEIELLKEQYNLEKMGENTSECKRSETWNKIYSIVCQLKLKESDGDDRMDKPSCTTEIEQLFNKLFITHTKSTKSINK